LSLSAAGSLALRGSLTATLGALTLEASGQTVPYEPGVYRLARVRGSVSGETVSGGRSSTVSGRGRTDTVH